MSVIPIRTLGDPILAQVAHPIEDVNHPQIQQLIEDLKATLVEANGVGIAAPQVGMGVQLLIIASRPNPRYPFAPQMDPIAVINPQVIERSLEQVQGWEGCLSVPDRRGLVSRAQRVVVRFTTQRGRVETVAWTDFVARIFQHEFDHLQGQVFLDRAPHSLLTEEQYHSQIVPSLFSQP